jgi:uncharacterized protein (DUF433 family)
MATTTRTIRLRNDLKAEVERIARRTRRSFSEVTQDLIDEAIRMRRVPGIYFSDEPAGRDAKIAGTGLAVWEIIAVHEALGGDVKALRTRFDWLNDAQIESALLYDRLYGDEIGRAIEENRVDAAHIAVAAPRSGRSGRR